MMKKALFIVTVCVLLASGLTPVVHASAEDISPRTAPTSKLLPATRVGAPVTDKHSPLGRFIMYAPWKTQAVNCDGVVDVAIEWSDAAYYDISDTSGQHDAIPDPLGTVDLYVKQDSFGVWFAVINNGDNSLDYFDNMGLYFDDDHDGCFPDTSLTNEGNIWVIYDTTSGGTTLSWWRSLQDTNCNVPLYDCYGDLFSGPSTITLSCCAISMTGGMVSYEVMVPYGMFDHEIDVPSPVGMEIGFFIYVENDPYGTTYIGLQGTWPSQGRPSTFREPCYYGDLYCEGEGEWYFKPGYPDYAPNGMPDFDQRKPGWDWPPFSGGGYYYCGPVAAGNCLWWFDSKYEPGNVPPPDSSDGFPLVEPWGPWDDHDTSNVRPFIDDLAARMFTQPGVGTYIDSMQKAIDRLLIEKGLQDSLEEKTYWMPDFYFIEEEIERSQDVILLLGYWFWTGYDWYREGGHFVTCAGVNSEALKIAICDPCLDNAETGGPGFVHDGSLITPHPNGHGPNVHDDAGNVSHDVYQVSLTSPSPGGSWWLPDYPPQMTAYFFGLNVPKRFEKYQAPRPHGEKMLVHTEVEAAVVICPKEPEWYFKPDYPDYAPSGMPDFDQKQDQWDNPPGSDNWTYCGPTALGNCLWWFDSKYQWLIDPYSPQPDTVNDDFPLVTAYGSGDDHDTVNVMPLINDLAWHMDTDGIRTGDGSVGTNVFEMEAAIAEWFLETETDTIFYKHTKKAPDFYWIEEEIERCEDVILLLGFWQYYGPDEWFRVGGHYVTCAGVNSDSLTIAFSDPFSDMAEMGFPGRVRDGILIPHAAGHGSYDHNDAGNVSHDVYQVVYDYLSPGGPWSIPGYPIYDDVVYSTQFANCPPEFGSLQVYEYNPALPVHTEIEYAVAISPIPDCWHYKGEYPDYAPDGMPDFDQNQHGWTGFCGPTAVANCLWWFDSKYQWLWDPGMPPPPYVYDTFDLVKTYIDTVDDHSYEQDAAGWDNVQYLIEDLVGYMGTDPVSGTHIDSMQAGIDRWLRDKGLDEVFYEHTLIDSTRNPEFFYIIESEIERSQDVILLLGFWEEYPPGSSEWWRIGGHYVTCAGVCSDSMKIMFSDPDFDQQEITYPDSSKWHNNAALVSHDVYSVGQSPSPGGFWGLVDYPGNIVGPRHQLENCPDHLLSYQDYWHGLPIYTEIEGAVLISPILYPPESVLDLEVYTAFGTTGAGSLDVRLIWSPVTTDIMGFPIGVDSYVIYRDTVPSFTPGPAKQLATTVGTTYVDADVAGDSSVNYYYYVNARKSGLESTNSRCVGEFDKDLVNTKKRGTRQDTEMKRR